MNARERAALQSALDALEVDDRVTAEGILFNLLNEGEDKGRKLSCPICGLRVRWPGALEDHARIVHNLDELALRDTANQQAAGAPRPLAESGNGYEFERTVHARAA